MTDQTRNLNPHAAAKFAMVMYGERYAAQNGGSMDFWDSLTDSEKRFCARVSKEIKAARPYTGKLQ